MLVVNFEDAECAITLERSPPVGRPDRCLAEIHAALCLQLDQIPPPPYLGMESLKNIDRSGGLFDVGASG